MIVDKAVSVLEKGGIVIYPSDTVYGIAVDGTNATALQKLDRLKNRRPDQKFSYNFSDLEMVKKFYPDLTSKQEEVLLKYLPGPFTFIVATDVSIRIPKNSVITDISKALGRPTTATSANITGKSPATSIKNLDAKLYLAADLLIEDKDFSANELSTIVDIRTTEPKIIRQGSLQFP
jgi:tRNA threonylcarbamoyl adenosine modification protein (Sua5/YciO/YrdC/YwlC family)